MAGIKLLRSLKTFNFLLILMLSCFSNSYSVSKVDSLINLIPNKNGIEKSKILYEVGEELFELNKYEESLIYYQKALNIRKELKDKKGIAFVLNTMGIIHRYLKNYDTCLDYYNRSLAIKKEIGDKVEIAKTLNNLGVVYKSMEEYDKAVNYYLEALEIKEEINDNSGISRTLNNIGLLFGCLKDYDKALHYLFSSLDLKKSLNDSIGMSNTYNNIGSIYEKLNNCEKAMDYFQKALTIKRKFNDRRGITDCFNYIGKTYSKQENFDKALEYFLKALELRRKLKNPNDLADIHNNLGYIYQKLNKINLAILHLDSAQYVAKKVNDKNIILENYYHWAKVYETKGEYQKAYLYLTLHNNIKDTIIQEQYQKSVIEAEARYNFDRKERELKLKEEKRVQNIRTIALLVTFLLGGILFIVYSLYRLKKKSNLQLQAEKEKAQESDRLKSAFLANMSHEIRTPMNAILGFTDLLKDPTQHEEDKIAYINIIEAGGQRMLSIINDLIDISKIESGQMQINISKVILKDQLDLVYNLLKNEAEKKGLELKLSVKNGSYCNSDQEKIQAVLINLLKNAIKFTSSGYIKLGYSLKNGDVIFFVKDTGSGIASEKQEHIFKRFTRINHNSTQEGTGLGLAISKAYIEMLGGKIWVKSKIEEGSTFYFTIPLKNEIIPE